MAVRLTFKKDFEAVGGSGKNLVTLMPCTTEGEEIEGILSCSVTQEVGSMPVMTLQVRVSETLADNAALRLKK